MSAVKVAWYLLAHYAPLLAVVPVDRIAAGPLPQGTALPAIAINQISAVRNSEISAQGKVCTARVQVSVLAASYPEQKTVLSLVRAGMPRTRGSVNGVNVSFVTWAEEGPDLNDFDPGIFVQTQDFMIRFVDP